MIFYYNLNCVNYQQKYWEESCHHTTYHMNVERNLYLLKINLKINFQILHERFLSNHLPTIFLEGYKDSVAKVTNSDWPKNPKSIFAS